MKRALIVALAAIALTGCQPTTSTSSSPSPAVATAAAKATATKPPAPVKPKMTKGQSEALGSAHDYLSTQAFSYKGLINQLVQGEGFTKAQATYGTAKAGL